MKNIYFPPYLTFLFPLFGLFSLLFLGNIFFAFQIPVFADTPPPDFERDFASYLLDESKSNNNKNGVETVYDMGINEHYSLKDNIRCLLYPTSYIQSIGNQKCSSTAGGKIWDLLRYVMVGIIFFFIVFVGIRLLISNPDSEKDKIRQSLKSLYYIAFGALLFFGSIWIIDKGLNFNSITSSSDLATHLSNGADSMLFQVISLLKILVFFIAIVMMVIYGFRIMTAMDKAEEARKHIRGAVNIIIALILVKIIDYIYYIAQLPDFTERASDIIISIAKILGFIIGGGAVLMVFYTGYLLLTDQGSEERMKQARTIIINILLVGLLLAFFLLIIYQVFNEFA